MSETGWSRRRVLQGCMGSAAALAAPAGWGAVESEEGLREPGTEGVVGAMTPLKVGEIKPAGWLERQLRVQADGMGGHLDEFWPDVGANSGWLGGTGESWERGPYFVDGLYPLAVQLGDARLMAKAKRFIDWTLNHQQATGMIGPASNDDWWPRMVMLKVLMQYGEASGDARVEPVLMRYFRYQLAELPRRPLRDWGKYRWQDEALVVAWLYGRTGDAKLLELAGVLRTQGFDWVGLFEDYPYTQPTTRAYLDAQATGGNSPKGMATHGVNNGQGLKTAAVEALLGGAGDGRDRARRRGDFWRQMETLDRFHGVANGMFTCDEHVAGLDPSHGTELCTVVETMYSLEVGLAAFGDAAIGDRLEKIAYNALPGTFTDDMWAHQYDQQANQIRVGLNSRPWTTNGTESNLYGLEPNFGCCTANFHQGWPKLTAHLWMRTKDDGLAAVAWAPCTVRTKVGGRDVRLRVETEYPFREMVRVRVEESGGRWPMRLRVPAWAKGATVRVNGEATQPVQAGTFARVERAWRAGDVVELRLPMEVRVTRSFHDGATVERGPLVFAHSPGESWVKLRDRGPTADWQVYPTRRWNYALATSEPMTVLERPVGARAFSAEGAGVRVAVGLRPLDSWRDADGVAEPVPASPVKDAGVVERVELVPYAAAKLRVTVMPVG